MRRSPEGEYCHMYIGRSTLLSMLRFKGMSVDDFFSGGFMDAEEGSEVSWTFISFIPLLDCMYRMRMRSLREMMRVTKMRTKQIQTMMTMSHSRPLTNWKVRTDDNESIV